VRGSVTIECWCDITNRSWPDPGTRGQLWWMSAKDADPGPAVSSVARVGDEPAMRRWERVGTTSTFKQVGSMVDFYADLTRATPWHLIGRCFLDYHHDVQPAVPTGDGWLVGGIKNGMSRR